MSYILDALNKSDEERQRDHVPNLKTVHRASTPRTARRFDLWRGLILVLLAANLGLVLVWLYPSVEDSADSHAAAPMENAGPASPAGAIEDATASRPLAGRMPTPAGPGSSAEENANADDESPVAVAATAQAMSPAAEAARDADPASQIIVPRPPGAPVQEIDPAMLPDILDLPTEIQRQIPDLTFASHIYSSDPRSRLVSINGRLSREGDRVAGQLRLLAITEEGVVLEFGSYRFRMSILRDWSFD